MSYEDFISKLWKAVGECPKNWRKGQKVFNCIESLYGSVAREVQFVDGIDCFYNDNAIDDFIAHAWVKIASNNLEK